MSEMLVRHGIRCLLFDLGDTLWYRADQDAWNRLEGVANQHALDLLRQHIDPNCLPQMNDPALGCLLRQAFDQQVSMTIRQAPLLEPDVCQALSNVLHSWGITEASRSLCRSLFEALRVRLPHSRPLFADAISTLTELQRRGYLLGIVTNRLWGGTPFYEDLQTIGLLDFFNEKHIAVSGDLGIRKPNPHIFEHALNALHIAPREAAMIGDSLSADILGAQPMGIYSIWKPKPWLRDWALTHASVQPALWINSSQSIARETFPGIDTADTQMPEVLEDTDTLPAGMHLTDDDYVLARANRSRGYLEQFLQGEIRPDHIIGELAELLDIFPRIA